MLHTFFSEYFYVLLFIVYFNLLSTKNIYSLLVGSTPIVHITKNALFAWDINIAYFQILQIQILFTTSGFTIYKIRLLFCDKLDVCRYPLVLKGILNIWH